MVELRTRRVPVLAQDPGVRRGDKALLAHIVVPWEDLETQTETCERVQRKARMKLASELHHDCARRCSVVY